MKKLILFLVLATAAAAYYFLGQNKRVYTQSKNLKQPSPIVSSINKNLIAKIKKKKFRTTRPKREREIDINKMHPCEALRALSKVKKPWTFLSNSNPHELYVDISDSLDKKKSKEELYAKLDYFSDIESYLPYLESIFVKAINYNRSPDLLDKLNDKLSSHFAQFGTNSSLEYQLTEAKQHYILGGLPYSKLHLKRISEDKQITSSNDLEKLLKWLYTKASTPSEISAAIETASRAPKHDFSFLLEIKKNNTSKDIQKILDKIALKLINKALLTKSALSLDSLSYDIAIKLHSKGDLIEKRYGTKEQVVNRLLAKSNISSPQGCDDRKIIDLCAKYCKR